MSEHFFRRVVRRLHYRTVLKGLARRAGMICVPDTRDPVLQELLASYQALRLTPRDKLLWEERLPRAAALSHLRNLFEYHAIDLVIDVGANRGQFGVALRQLGYSGEIVSFEPLSEARRHLAPIADADGCWRVRHEAVGCSVAEVELQVYGGDVFSSLHSLDKVETRGLPETWTRQTGIEKVPLITIDSAWQDLTQNRSRRVFLKTDTQGHDLDVIAGAAAHMPEIRMLMTEASAVCIYKHTPRFPEVVAVVEGHGLLVSGVFPIANRLPDFSAVEMDWVFTRPPSP